MKRSGPLKRKTPLRADPEKVKAWKDGSRTKIKPRSDIRRTQEITYGGDRPAFLRKHKVCPVTGGKTSQVHHSARRQGQWLNLRRYWIAVSPLGHEWIENNAKEAEAHGLMHRINTTYAEHMAELKQQGLDPDVPLFYENWSGNTLATSYGEIH
jgi:hypothetical protein